MIGQLLAKVIGTQNERDLKKLRPIVGEIGAFEPTLQRLSDEQLRAKTTEFKTRLANGESLDDVWPIFTSEPRCAYNLAFCDLSQPIELPIVVEQSTSEAVFSLNDMQELLGARKRVGTWAPREFVGRQQIEMLQRDRAIAIQVFTKICNLTHHRKPRTSRGYCDVLASRLRSIDGLRSKKLCGRSRNECQIIGMTGRSSARVRWCIPRFTHITMS